VGKRENRKPSRKRKMGYPFHINVEEGKGQTNEKRRIEDRMIFKMNSWGAKNERNLNEEENPWSRTNQKKTMNTKKLSIPSDNIAGAPGERGKTQP